MQIYDLEFDLDGFIRDMEERSARRLAERANKSENLHRGDTDEQLTDAEETEHH